MMLGGEKERTHALVTMADVSSRGQLMAMEERHDVLRYVLFLFLFSFHNTGTSTFIVPGTEVLCSNVLTFESEKYFFHKKFFFFFFFYLV